MGEADLAFLAVPVLAGIAIGDPDLGFGPPRKPVTTLAPRLSVITW